MPSSAAPRTYRSTQRAEQASRTRCRVLESSIDVAGDDLPVPVLERDWLRQARASGSVGELLSIVLAVSLQRLLLLLNEHARDPTTQEAR